ncbi:MAG: SUMF1/EgtB/PvdO family nonheme iron enzyme [bacterium]|nr:SUMF1/EgtB/PvdO family nonheme iron enzyme [bacterium]
MDTQLRIPAKYQQWVMDYHWLMDVRQLDPNSRATQIGLEQLYIPLEAANPYYRHGNEKEAKRLWPEVEPGWCEKGEGETQPLFIDIEELLDRENCILLRGGAGMGKTTLVKHLLYSITNDSGPAALTGFLPVMILLRDLWPICEREPALTLRGIGFETLLAAYLENCVPVLEMDVVKEFLRERRVLLMVDGLDEVPDHFRRVLLKSIAVFRSKHRDCLFLFTGRPNGIDETAKHLFLNCLRDIEPLNDKQVEKFIGNWFNVVSGAVQVGGQETAMNMLGEIRVNPYVSVFTENPLLLTALCILYLDDKRLPGQRVELYLRIVENLMNRRFQQLEDRDGVSRVEDYLKHMAFHMQERNLKRLDVGEAKKLLKHYFPINTTEESISQYNRKIESLFEMIESGCGLLKRLQTGVVEFFHITFQEFMAARYMVYEEKDYKKYLEKNYWEETLLLYAGLINREWKEKANDLVREMLTYPYSIEDGKKGGDSSELRRIRLLGGKVLKDIQEYKRDEAIVSMAVELLNAIIVSDSSVEQRFEAGEILGYLGDRRIEIQSPSMVLVEAGEFIRGGEGHRREKPVRYIYLDEFEIGTFPVTNLEFKAFMVDGGYASGTYWTTEGWKWLREENISEPESWHNRQWNGLNFPVVGVSWYEASAYAKWISIKTGKNFALPTEAQWEKAARVNKGLNYPWGNEFNKKFCNSSESGLKRTSPVGIFPKGVSFCGCQDMAGNVWEWCADWYDDDYYKGSPQKNPQGPLKGSGRVMRGGSWNFTHVYCRAAFRGWNLPADRFVLIGFRLLRSL